MPVKNARTAFLLGAIALLSAVFFSCATTPDVPAYPGPEADHSISCNPQKNVVEDGETYLFFRLYEPNYSNPVCIENILKKFINLVEVNGIVASHSAIGFSLEDEFAGITSSEEDGTGRNFCLERCTDTASNAYMRKCDSAESLQTTYALRVRTDEFDRALRLTNHYLNSGIKYSIKLNFRILGWELGRRYFTPKERRNIRTMEAQERPLVNRPGETEFNCSSIIAYILINSVDSVRLFFEERGLDYNKIIPSDIAEIPGMQKLFTSTWDDYDLRAEEFMRQYTASRSGSM